MIYPAIAEAAVLSFAHEKWNEQPLLVAVKKPHQTVSEEDLLTWFDGKVARWWKPDDVIFDEQLPHTATGKISKLSLREGLCAGAANHARPAAGPTPRWH